MVHGPRRDQAAGRQRRARLASGTAHLGESIYYQVLLNGQRAYSRTMDCRRATRPTWNEFRTVAAEVRAGLNAALERAYPADHLNMDQLEYIEELEPEEDDGSEGFWGQLFGG